MKFRTFLTLLLPSSALALYTGYSSNTDSLAVPDDNDRGTFIFSCKGVEDACQNACFDTFCRRGSNTPPTFTKATPAQKEKNRPLAGCTIGAHHNTSPGIIGSMPFSQLFNFVQGLSKPSCDEWPPASVVREDNHQPSLRIMEDHTNEAAGTQLNVFYTGGKGIMEKQPKRKGGTGRILPGQTFTFEFNTTGAVDDKIPACHKKCPVDTQQFHLSKLAGKKGTIHQPYEFGNDNHYKISNTDHVIKACEIEVFRSKDSDGILYDVKVQKTNQGGKTGESVGHATGHPNNGDPLELQLSGLDLDTKITILPNTGGLDGNIAFELETKGGNSAFEILNWKQNDEFHVGGGKKTHFCKERARKLVGQTATVCSFPCFF